jgi:hypothetical protein
MPPALVWLVATLCASFPSPGLPPGSTPSEKRGRRFFENVGPDFAAGLKPGLCSHCHSGPLLNQTNEFADDFILLPIPAGQRFLNVGISEFNTAGNPVRSLFSMGVPAMNSTCSARIPGGRFRRASGILRSTRRSQASMPSKSRRCAASGTRPRTSTTIRRRHSRPWLRITPTSFSL